MGTKVMLTRIILCAFITGAILQTSVMAQEKKGDSKAKVDSKVKELSGISIIGNQEAPKSLYIVPWQNSEVGVATSLQSGLFDDSMRPLYKEVFLRELNFYELSHH